MSSGISSASEGEESHFQTLNKADRGHDHLPLFYCLRRRHALLVEELLSHSEFFRTTICHVSKGAQVRTFDKYVFNGLKLKTFRKVSVQVWDILRCISRCVPKKFVQWVWSSNAKGGYSQYFFIWQYLKEKGPDWWIFSGCGYMYPTCSFIICDTILV